MCHTLSTIVRGFVEGEETSFAYRRYEYQVITVEDLPTNPYMGGKETMEFDTIFFEKDVTIIHPHDNDPMLIIVICDDWEIKRVLIYQ